MQHIVQGVEIVGRGDMLTSLSDALTDKSQSIVLLTGHHGVGKTAIAQSLAEYFKAIATNRFKTILFQSCWRDKWTNIIARISRELFGAGSLKTLSINRLLELLLETAKEEPILLVLDNIEQQQLDEFKEFSQTWLTHCPASAIVATGTDFLGFESLPNTFLQQVSGLENQDALPLFGDTLRNRFGDERLSFYSEKLRGVPLDILYTRWMGPTDFQQLNVVTDAISRGTFDASKSVENVLSELSQSPIHFMALGLVNQLEFEEGLLGYLWDRLSSGTVEAYAAHRRKLIDQRLLMPIAGTSQFRVNEQVHKFLSGVLAKRMGGVDRLKIVHYLISEYFRKRFDAHPTTDSLSGFVVHSLASGELGRAYRHVFANIRPDENRQLGDLEAIKQPFYEFGATTAREIKKTIELFLAPEIVLSNEQYIGVTVELAHLASDLGEFQDCIRYTDLAIERVLSEGIDGAQIQILRRCWYHRGVAYYNTGNPIACLESYYRIIEHSGMDRQLGILALGYFAHCLMYIDEHLSLKYGGWSVDFARSFGQNQLLCKNLASYGEALTFLGKLDLAQEVLKEAEEICIGDTKHSTQSRELGRILGSRSALALCRGKLDESVELSEQAIQLSATMGDYRRVSFARSYKAIAMKRQGRHHEAVSEMREAILLVPVNNGRYVSTAMLTYYDWIKPDCKLGTILERPDGDTVLTGYLAAAIQQPGWDLYVKFWKQQFCPALGISSDFNHS